MPQGDARIDCSVGLRRKKKCREEVKEKGQGGGLRRRRESNGERTRSRELEEPESQLHSETTSEIPNAQATRHSDERSLDVERGSERTTTQRPEHPRPNLETQ